MSREENVSDKIGKNDTCPDCGKWRGPDHKCLTAETVRGKESQACCACLKVHNLPEAVTATTVRDRWLCEACGAPFIRKPAKTVPGETLRERREWDSELRKTVRWIPVRLKEDSELQESKYRVTGKTTLQIPIEQIRRCLSGATRDNMWYGYLIDACNIIEDQDKRIEFSHENAVSYADERNEARDEIARLKAELKKRTHLLED